MTGQISSSKNESIVNAVNSNRLEALIALIALIFENQRQPMTKDAIPYLCGGTFLAQVIRARANRKTPTDYTNGQKESLTENETFRRLISIFRIKDFDPGGDSLKTYTTGYKTCTKEYRDYLQFLDNDLRRDFDDDVKSDRSVALYMMSEFVSDLTDDKKGKALCRCLLDMLLHDPDVKDDDVLYVCKNPVTRQQLKTIDHFDLPYFLLGVWHYIIMNRSEYNLNGAATYNEWYPGNGKAYKGTIGNGIDYDITVKCSTIPEPESKDPEPEIDTAEATSSYDAEPQPEATLSDQEASTDAKVVNQYFNNPTVVYQNGDKNVHIDHVDVLNI